MDSSGPIYFDHHSHSLVDPRVAAVVSAALLDLDANPHSTHGPGERARAAIEDARRELAALVGVEPASVIFTSGATEANNLALRGMTKHLADMGRRGVLVSAGEHPSVLHAFDGCDTVSVDLVPLDAEGRIDLGQLDAMLDAGTGLVSVAPANHEIGTIQPIAEIARRVRAAGALMHCDLAQTAGRLPIAAELFDLASVSAHKMHGPIGIGALIVSRRLRRALTPMLHGGGQEGRLRPGTLSPALAAGFGEACRLARAEMAADGERIRALRDALLHSLLPVGGLYVHGSMDRLPGNLNISFDGVDGEALVMRLRDTVALSTGSACTSTSLEPSHVLLAIGLDRPRAEGAIRIGLGRQTTRDDIARASAAISTAVGALRATLRKVA